MTSEKNAGPRAALQKCVDILGGQTALGKILGVPQSQIWAWLFRDNSINSKYVIGIEKAVNSKVTRHQLNPEVFGEMINEKS